MQQQNGSLESSYPIDEPKRQCDIGPWQVELLPRTSYEAAYVPNDLVIGFAFAGWMLAQVLGARLGWPVQLVFVFDLLGFLGLSWGLVLTYQVYRARKAAAADRPQAKVVGKSNKARTRRR